MKIGLEEEKEENVHNLKNSIYISYATEYRISNNATLNVFTSEVFRKRF